MNVWTFSGRCGADAELRKTQSNEDVLSFRVANDIGFGDRKTTQWVSCSYWGKRAVAIADYIKKGDRITVSGELKLESYTNKQGVQESKLAVRVNDVDLAARNESGSQQGGGGGRDYGSEPPKGGAGGRGGGKPAFDQDLDDEVPFVAV